MDIEKIVNSKWYNWLDILYRLFILNVLTILTPSIIAGGPFLYWYLNEGKVSGIFVVIALILFILILIPSYITTFICIKLSKEEKVENVFKLFFIYLIDTFKRIYIIELIILPVSTLYAYAAYYYWTLLGPNYFKGFNSTSIFAIIGFIFLFFSLCATVFAFLHLPIVVAYFRMSPFNYLKLSFYMAFKYFFKTILYLFLLLFPIILFISMNFIFRPIYMFYGISGPLYIIYLSSRELYVYLSNNIEDIKDENKLDIKGEQDETRN